MTFLLETLSSRVMAKHRMVIRGIFKRIGLFQSTDFQQHVHWPAHTSGHTLDLVIADSDNIAVTGVRPGSFISDHESVLFVLTHPKPQTQYAVVQSRKINNIVKAKFQGDILSQSLCKSPSSDLTTLTDQ